MRGDRSRGGNFPVGSGDLTDTRPYGSGSALLSHPWGGRVGALTISGAEAMDRK